MHTALPESQTAQFRCPGEPYDISLAVHLGRLASYYPKCRDCVHRNVTATLPQSRVRRLQEIGRRAMRPASPHPYGVAGAIHTEITRRLVGQWAGGLAEFLIEQSRLRQSSADQPAGGLDRSLTVVVGGDGRATSAELVAAACETLRYTGCDVADLGAVSAPLLVYGLQECRANGGLLIGNPLSAADSVGLTFWNATGEKLSLGGGLERVEELSTVASVRRGRRHGVLRSGNVETGYLEPLQQYFHALRPLRLIVDCRNSPVGRSLKSLIANTACELLPVQPETKHGETALERLARQVIAEHAHAGVWIDGDGETICLIDESGRAVSTERLQAGIASLGEARSTDDALRSLALVLVALSQSDRPASAVFASP